MRMHTIYSVFLYNYIFYSINKIKHAIFQSLQIESEYQFFLSTYILFYWCRIYDSFLEGFN